MQLKEEPGALSEVKADAEPYVEAVAEPEVKAVAEPDWKPV